jgi:hypothetical protein
MFPASEHAAVSPNLAGNWIPYLVLLGEACHSSHSAHLCSQRFGVSVKPLEAARWRSYRQSDRVGL